MQETLRMNIQNHLDQVMEYGTYNCFTYEFRQVFGFGDFGPTGPTGPTGARGLTGPTGAIGYNPLQEQEMKVLIPEHKSPSQQLRDEIEEQVREMWKPYKEANAKQKIIKAYSYSLPVTSYQEMVAAKDLIQQYVDSHPNEIIEVKNNVRCFQQRTQNIKPEFEEEYAKMQADNDVKKKKKEDLWNQFVFDCQEAGFNTRVKCTIPDEHFDGYESEYEDIFVCEPIDNLNKIEIDFGFTENRPPYHWYEYEDVYQGTYTVIFHEESELVNQYDVQEGAKADGCKLM